MEHHRNGQVSQGVLSILEELPIIKVNVKDLPSIVANPGKLLDTMSEDSQRSCDRYRH